MTADSRIFSYPLVEKRILKWIEKYVKDNQLQSLVVGVSGGIDSAVVSTLCAKVRVPVFALGMPIHQDSTQESMSDFHLAWLEEKYPGWNDTYGKCWDMVVDNIRNGRIEKTTPEAPPLICNMCGLEVTGVAGNQWSTKDHYLDYEGRRYHFCSEVDKWIFELEPDRYKGHKSIIDRLLDGTVPPGPDGLYEYMGQSPSERGVCGYNFNWIDGYESLQAAE